MILVLLSITARFMVQLTSTLLLSDLAPAPVETFPVVSSSNFVSKSLNGSNIATEFYTDPWLSTPLSFPLFVR